MERPASDRDQLGTDTVATPPETLTEIRSAAAGVFVKFGTLVAAMAGAYDAAWRYGGLGTGHCLSLIHISEPTRRS